jgi:predicted dehydrogenase
VKTNPVLDKIGRPLRLAVIGGGPGSFIGATHRAAARLDGRYEIVAGAVSSDPDRSQRAAAEIGVDPARAYVDASEMLDREADRPDGAEVVAIMTPNDSHHHYAMSALRGGFDVVCDKPITNTLAEALDIVAEVAASGLVFCLTHNYTGYPMVRQARAMVEEGRLGIIRLVQVEYVQGGKADENDPDPAAGLPWRYDPIRGGPSLVMGDIGTHAHNLLRFITGLEVTEVAAEIGHVAPNRLVDDFAAAMLRLDNGAKGTFWVTQAAAGVENCLRIRVSGTPAPLSGNRRTRPVWSSGRSTARRLCTHRTDQVFCPPRRALRGSWPVIPRASRRRSPTSTPMPPRRSPPAAAAPHRTRSPCSSPTNGTAPSGSGSWKQRWRRAALVDDGPMPACSPERPFRTVLAYHAPLTGTVVRKNGGGGGLHWCGQGPPGRFRYNHRGE